MSHHAAVVEVLHVYAANEPGAKVATLPGVFLAVILIDVEIGLSGARLDPDGRVPVRAPGNAQGKGGSDDKVLTDPSQKGRFLIPQK